MIRVVKRFDFLMVDGNGTLENLFHFNSEDTLTLIQASSKTNIGLGFLNHIFKTP